MSWFTEYRQEWIAETLRVFGYINRSHLVRKFNISVPQASADLHKFQEQNPGFVEYSVIRKRYELSKRG